MNSKTLIGAVTIVSAIVFGLAPIQASARGAVAGVLENIGVIDSTTADALDDMHRDLGKPLDKLPQLLIKAYIGR